MTNNLKKKLHTWCLSMSEFLGMLMPSYNLCCPCLVGGSNVLIIMVKYHMSKADRRKHQSRNHGLNHVDVGDKGAE